MRLLDRLPELPPQEGNLWTHSTGGEHATKFIGTEGYYNPLRAAELETISGDPLEPISQRQLGDMLLEHDYEVVFVDRHDLPDNAAGSSGLVAGAIAARIKSGRFEKTIKATELVIHPDLRKRGIASFALWRLANSEHFGSGEATELVVDTTVFKTEDWFRDKLIETGFRHTDSSGSPGLWLPGNVAYPKGNLDDPEIVAEILKPMPDDWNGYFDFYPETDPQRQIFRNGRRVGVIRYTEGSGDYDEYDRHVQDFRLFDGGGIELDETKGVRHDDAMIALLNNYQLVA